MNEPDNRSWVSYKTHDLSPGQIIKIPLDFYMYTHVQTKRRDGARRGAARNRALGGRRGGRCWPAARLLFLFSCIFTYLLACLLACLLAYLLTYRKATKDNDPDMSIVCAAWYNFLVKNEQFFTEAQEDRLQQIYSLFAPTSTAAASPPTAASPLEPPEPPETEPPACKKARSEPTDVLAPLQTGPVLKAVDYLETLAAQPRVDQCRHALQL